MKLNLINYDPIKGLFKVQESDRSNESLSHIRSHFTYRWIQWKVNTTENILPDCPQRKRNVPSIKNIHFYILYMEKGCNKLYVFNK